MQKWWCLSCAALLFILALATLPRIANQFFVTIGWQENTHSLLDARASLHTGANFRYGFIGPAGSDCHDAQTRTKNALYIDDSVRTRIALAQIALCNGVSHR